MTAQLPEEDLLNLALDSDNPSKILTRIQDVLHQNPDDPLALAARGVALKRDGDQASAISALLRSVDASFNELELYPRINRAVHTVGLSDDFLKSLEARVKGSDATAAYWLSLGRFQFFLNRNSEAVASFVEVTTRKPSVDFVWFELARAAVDAGNPSAALNALDQLERLEPKSAASPLLVGLRAVALAQGRQANEAVRLWRNSGLPLTGTETQHRGIQLAQTLLQNVPASAEDALEILNDIEPHIQRRTEERTAVRLGQALALERLNRVDEALTRIQNALASSPAPGEAAAMNLVHVRLLNRKGEFQKALDVINRIDTTALDAELRAQILLQQGTALSGMKQNDLALPRLEEARRTIRDRSVLVVVLMRLGSVLNELNRFDEALSTFDEAFNYEPPDDLRHNLYLRQCTALYRLGRIDAAIDKLDQAIQTVPENSDRAVIVQLHLEKAAMVQAAGPARVSEALKSVDVVLTALSSDKQTADTCLRALGIRAWGQGIQRDQTALETINQMIALRPNLEEDLAFVGSRWNILIQLEKYPDALAMVDAVSKSQSAVSSHPNLRMYRAETIRQMGDMQGYLREMEAAIAVPPEHAGDPGAWLSSAVASVVTRRWKDARTALEQLKALTPQLYDGPIGRALRGAVMTGTGEFQNAIALLKPLSDVPAPWGLIATQALVQALTEMQDLDGAITALDRLVAMATQTPNGDPAMPAFALVQKSQYLIRRKKPELALVTLDQIKRLPRAGTFADMVDIMESIARAAALSRLQQHAKALDAINSAIDIEAKTRVKLPEDFIKRGWTSLLKGIFLLEADREEEALRAFEGAQRAGLSGNEALVWQGYALLVLEDPDRALQKFELAIQEATTRNDVPQQFEALVGKGRSLHRAHTYEAAIGVYREALRVGALKAESDAAYWRRLGETYYSLERYSAAHHAFLRGWEIENSADFALGISAALIRQKRHADALAFLDNKAAGLPGRDARVKFNRGVALWSLAKKSEAKKAIKEASEAGVAEAAEVFASLEPRRDSAMGWWEVWFGDEASISRRIVGVFLLVTVASALAAPAFAYFKDELDWKAAIVPAAVALVLLLIPSLKGLSLSTEGVKLDIEPSALKGSEELPKVDLLPLGSGVYLAVSTPPKPELRPPDFAPALQKASLVGPI